MAKEDLILLVRLDRGNHRILDRYLLPKKVLRQKRDRILSTSDTVDGWRRHQIGKLSHAMDRMAGWPNDERLRFH